MKGASAMYLQNKYTRWYYIIIQRAQTRSITGYTERHHIIPKSLGGSNAKDNLVVLTAREHFVCHLLLTKMTEGKARRSMCYAAWQMTFIKNRERYSPTARVYELLRKQLSESYTGVPKTYKHWLGKKHSNKSKKLQSEIKRGELNPNFGKKHTDEAKRRIGLGRKGVVQPKYICEHCRKTVGGLTNYTRWHGNRCKSILSQ